MIKLYDNNEVSREEISNMWYDLMNTARWTFDGATGYPDEPFRHWTCMACNDEDTYNKCMRLYNSKLKSLFEKEVGSKLEMFSIIVTQFNHGDSSWLHQDLSADYTCILYMNPEWDINWGGFTTFTNNDKDKIIFTSYPKCGTFVLFDSQIWHGPTAVGREAKYPRMGITYQMKKVTT